MTEMDSHDSAPGSNLGATPGASPAPAWEVSGGASASVRPPGPGIAVDHSTLLPSRPFTFTALLTGLAGFLDAAAFIKLNHLYVSFMSGNSTHLGMAIATGDMPDILAILAIATAFVAGASVGTWITDHAGARLLARVLGAEGGYFFLPSRSHFSISIRPP